MTLAEFQATLTNNAPPIDFDNVLQSLWYDAKGNWEMAHTIAQEIHTDSGSWIHAYLHRKEGDSGNAAYWYHMAHKDYPTVELAKEWEQLVVNFLARRAVASQ
jgi:hypothetical protein